MNERAAETERSLKGQGAVVTGGGRNIGRAIAQELARAGAKVAVFARSGDEIDETVRLIQQEGGEALAVQVDVTDAEGIDQAVAEVRLQFGSVDILVNNAGGLGSIGPLWHEDFDAEEWWRVVEVNLRGPFVCSRSVLPEMVARNKGCIINIGSGIGAMKFAHYDAYAVSKAGLTKLSENLAEAVKDFGVKVFTLDPGLVRTEWHDSNLEKGVYDKWLGPVVRQWFDDGVDVPPTRAAEMARRLASGEADTLTGCYLTFADDLSALVANAAEIQDKELYTLRLRTPD
jgi:NAD(P)-dependent dehydrogenase (short-subunit alcohol dehydrogenase family)